MWDIAPYRGAETTYDPEFTPTIQWDIPVLDGYDWTEIPTKARVGFVLRSLQFWSLEIHPHDRFDAIICLTGYIRATFWIALLCRTDGRHCIFVWNGRQ